MTAGLAHAGGPLAAAGLALLLLAHPPRPAAGRARRVGARVRVPGRLPRAARAHEGLRGGGRRRRRRRRRRSPALFRRWPWLLAVVGARLRTGADSGARRLDRLEPAAAAVRGRRRRRARCSAGSCSAATAARASSARSRWPLGLLVAWSGLSARLDGGPARGRGRRCSSSGSRSGCSRSRSPASPGAARWLSFLYAQLVGDGASRSRRSASTSTRRATSSGTRR